MSNHEPTNQQEHRLLHFASTMPRIPRHALRCDVYGTVRAVVDERHARNVFAKVAPTASGSAIYAACVILQERLDDR